MVFLEVRVDALEKEVARVAPLEAEVADMRGKWQEVHRVQSEVLIDVRVMLNEHRKFLHVHGQFLREHGKAIDGLRETQLEHGKAIDGLRETQLEHGKAIGDLRETQLEHGKAIGDLRDEFGGLRNEFGEFRDEVRVGITGIARSLDRLINEQGQSPS